MRLYMPLCERMCIFSLWFACGTNSCWCYQPFDVRWLRLAVLHSLWRVRQALYCAFAVVVAHFLHATLLISIIGFCFAIKCNRCGLLLLLLTFVAGVWQLVLMFHFQFSVCFVYTCGFYTCHICTLLINITCGCYCFAGWEFYFLYL